MFVRKKRNRSEATSMVVVYKNKVGSNRYRTLKLCSLRRRLTDGMQGPAGASRWRPIFLFPEKRIGSFVTLKTYKEQKYLLRRFNIAMSVDKVLKIAKTFSTINICPNGSTMRQTLFLTDEQRSIKSLFDDRTFRVTRCHSQKHFSTFIGQPSYFICLLRPCLFYYLYRNTII